MFLAPSASFPQAFLVSSLPVIARSLTSTRNSYDGPPHRRLAAAPAGPGCELSDSEGSRLLVDEPHKWQVLNGWVRPATHRLLRVRLNHFRLHQCPNTLRGPSRLSSAVTGSPPF